MTAITAVVVFQLDGRAHLLCIVLRESRVLARGQDHLPLYADPPRTRKVLPMADMVEALSLSSLIAGTLEYAILVRHREERRQTSSWRLAAQASARQALTRLTRQDPKWMMRRWTNDGTRFRIEG
jgi:hypothetical protein